jgi:hypothetical protein
VLLLTGARFTRIEERYAEIVRSDDACNGLLYAKRRREITALS